MLYQDLAVDPQNFIQNPANFNIGLNTVFAEMDIFDEELATFFKLTTTTLDAIQASVKPPSRAEDARFIHDLTIFKKHPLVYTRPERDAGALIDFPFLGEKISQGLYHTVLDVLRADPTGDDDYNTFLKRYWGDVFEIYVNDRLRDSYQLNAKSSSIRPCSTLTEVSRLSMER
ncbi:MAG TPA: hypothetical protein VJX67_11255 [Blastocatellia bacterium]|nr:hypothetical protein [Blastocatellia bacterium]